MTLKKIKYCFIYIFVSSLSSIAQESDNNQAVVTIVGNPVTTDNNDPVNDKNYQQFYQQINTPPSKGTLSNNPILIEPTLENGMHMRFELSPPPPRSSEGVYASADISDRSKKRSASISERSFNIKKRLKTWLPKRKKRYRPNLCVGF